MSHLLILRTYAQKPPEALPSSVLFKKSAKNIVIFDAYPKSIFHFLILPRLAGQGTTEAKDTQASESDIARLDNLQALLYDDKQKAREIIDALAKEAMGVKKEIEDEMVERYGFKWDVWMGFHGAPSMAYVLSASLHHCML